MALHKQLSFEAVSWEIFNIPEMGTSGASFTCVRGCYLNYIIIHYTLSKLWLFLFIYLLLHH